MGWGQGGGLGTARWAGGDGDGAGKSLTVAAGWAWWCPPTYKGVQELGGGALGNTAGSTHSGVGAEHGTPEALPKDEAVNCYLSNQAVSRLPGVRQWQWKVSRCQSEEWHRWGPSVLRNFCCEGHGKHSEVWPPALVINVHVHKNNVMHVDTHTCRYRGFPQ